MEASEGEGEEEILPPSKVINLLVISLHVKMHLNGEMCELLLQLALKQVFSFIMFSNQHNAQQRNYIKISKLNQATSTVTQYFLLF